MGGSSRPSRVYTSCELDLHDHRRRFRHRWFCARSGELVRPVCSSYRSCCIRGKETVDELGRVLIQDPTD